MSEIGRLAIVLGFVVALWGVLASVLGASSVAHAQKVPACSARCAATSA